MIEFGSPGDAQVVKEALDGKKIYDDSSLLKIEYAYESVYKLRVIRNDDDSWDFTRDLSVSDINNNSVVEAGSMPLLDFARTDQAVVKRRARSPMEPDTYRTKFMRPETEYYHEGRATMQLSVPSVMGRAFPLGPVCMIYDLNMEKATPNRLFNLLCLYGDVMRVKFLATKESCAMVEMGGPESASRVISNLSGRVLFGNEITVRPSHQARLLSSAEMGATCVRLGNGALSFEDFSCSPNNRFRTRERAEKNRIVPPSRILHFFNLPVDCGEDSVRAIFAGNAAGEGDEIGRGRGNGAGEDGLSVGEVKMFAKTDVARTLNGLIEFGCVEAATDGLAMHNHHLITSPSSRNGRPHVLKLCFSVNESIE